MITALVTDQVIDTQRLVSQIKSEQAGAMVIFSGDVRDNDHGRSVKSLTYEIHPSASTVISEIVARIASQHDLLGVAAVHRFGEIPIGESAFTVIVSSRHRACAFKACSEIVDGVKEELPIWKYQVFADGTDEWVNNA